MHLQIIIGSVRDGRRAKPVADWVYQQAAVRQDCSVELIDLKEWNLPMFALAKPPIMGNYEDPLQQQWADKVREADAYLFVAPEYNHGYSPALKNALDFLYAEWTRKPASFVSYGGVGGARGIQVLRLVLVELRMAPMRDALHITNVANKISDDSFVGDEKDASQLNVVLDDLLWWSHALSSARQGA